VHSLEDLIDSRIGVHDSNQFEVKLDYAIDPQALENRYHLEAYFFVPKSLGISAHTYSREAFYRDVQGYVRFKTPTMNLTTLTDPTHQRSPLAKIHEALANLHLRPDDTAASQQLDYELRLFACLVRANLRDRMVEMSDHVANFPDQGLACRLATDSLVAGCDKLLRDVVMVGDGLRALRPAFSTADFPRWPREMFACVDEYLSVVIESHLILLLEDLDKVRTKILEVGPLRERVAKLIQQEQDYRVGCQYITVLEQGQPNERFVYRRGFLKKLVMSVLFLEVTKEREGRGLSDLVAAVAAGAAMLFAVIASIASQQKWGINSIPFVLAAVTSYMLKDRIKDWLKLYFSKKMTRFLADYTENIFDPFTGTIVGVCREAFSFIDARQLPMAVHERRHAGETSLVESAHKAEVIMKYEKDVRFDGGKIAALHGRLHDINDIIRFNVSEFLARADDPSQSVPTFDRKRSAVHHVECPKTYHINVVFVLRAHGAVGPELLHRVRVVLDKRGIRRLEEL